MPESLFFNIKLQAQPAKRDSRTGVFLQLYEKEMLAQV